MLQLRRFAVVGLLTLGACAAPSEDEARSDDDDATADDDDSTADDDDASPGDPWEPVIAAIEASDIEDVTVLLGTANGAVFSHSRGDSTADRVYPIASASKLLTSLTILTLVEGGWSGLDQPIRPHLGWWTDDPADPRYDVTLRQLLSFTSGLQGGTSGVPCVEDPDTTLDACAQAIHDSLFAFDPGSTFYYGPAHLQIAAAAAAGDAGDRWHRVFRDQIGAPLGLAAATGFALPSLSNPRAAGGGTASAEDYGAVLTALAAGDLLGPALVAELVADHTAAPVVLEEVPAAATDGRSWHYALGCWRECAGDEYTAACDEPGVISSPGAFGFYPWWDRATDTWGVVATQLLVGGPERTVPFGQELAELAAPILAAEGR